MKPRRYQPFGLVACLLAVAALHGCGTFGATQPETFSQKLAAGLITIKTARAFGMDLFNAGLLSPTDGENVQKTLDDAREGVTVARELRATNLPAAASKLDATLLIANQTLKYLCRYRPTEPACIKKETSQ